MGKLDGHCLCGSITYECDADPIMTGICHCTDCQRQSGTAFSINVGVPLAALTVNGEDKVIETARDEGGTAYRHFCGNCGSPLYSVLSIAEEIAWIKAGTLDDPSLVEPQIEAWTRSQQPWAHLPEVEGRGYFAQGVPVG